MLRSIFPIFAAFFAAMAIPSVAHAVGEDVFVVPRVAVQAQADSATVAKRIAQRNGRRRAMDILLRRLTVEEDWPYLPTLASDADGEVPELGGLPATEGVFDPQAGLTRTTVTLSDSALEDLESGYEVYSEKSSARTYRAFITYRFKPDEVRRLLKNAGIPYSEAQTRNTLVIPVLQTQNGVYLWEDNNPWMAAWNVRPYNNELTPMLAPLGDLEDAAALSARQALAINQGALHTMAQRYSTPQVIIAHAYLQQVDGVDKLRVRFISGYRETTALDQFDELDANDPLIGVAAEADNAPQTPLYAADPGEVLVEAWYSQPSGNFPALAERSIEETIAKYAKPWKQRTLIDHTVTSLLNVSAYYGSIGEWSQIRSALVSTPLIGAVQVKSLSRRGADLLIQSFGDPDKLIVAMEAQGLVLWPESGDTWNIATPEMALRRKQNDRRRSRFGEIDQTQPGVAPVSYPVSE